MNVYPVPDELQGDIMPEHLSTKPPTIACIGCGAIAERYYLPALARHPSVLEKLILVDRDDARARAMADQFNVKRWVPDYHAALDEIDAAIVALPTNLHHPVSMDLLTRGVHVLCEKPLAESADKAREMVEAAGQAGVVLAANYQQRLFASFIKVKQLLDDGTLGKPRAITYRVGEVFAWPTVSGFYFNAQTSARGILRDRGAHVLDIICWWLGGKPTLIVSQNDSFGGSEAVACVQFEHDGCTGEVKLSWLSKFPCWYEVACERGAVEGDVYDYRSILLQTGSGRQRRLALPTREKLYTDIAYRIVGNFVRAVAGQEAPIVPGADVLNSIEFTDECYAAATRFDLPWYDIPEVQHGR
jgi:predicted dehydrogenase